MFLGIEPHGHPGQEPRKQIPDNMAASVGQALAQRRNAIIRDMKLTYRILEGKQWDKILKPDSCLKNALTAALEENLEPQPGTVIGDAYNSPLKALEAFL